MSYLPRPPGSAGPLSDAPAMADLEATAELDQELLNVFDFERRAADLLPPGPLGYFAGGALDERTLSDNRAAFERRRIVPRVMTDVSTVDTGVEVLGQPWRWPLFVAPMALLRMAHPDGELAVARAAAARGITYVHSTSASTDMADVAATGPGRRWYQLYLLRDPGARRAMVERAVSLGYEALVLTADLQRLGRRERDWRTGFRIPEGIGLPNVARAAGVTAAEGAQVEFAARLTWDDLAWVAGFGRPVVVKGVLHPDDARLAVEHGAAAVAVSNHGGRQLDGAIASLDALPAVAEAVDGRVPVLLDGGVRRGTDVLIALALGATAVGMGRPVIWGLAVGGEAGVARVLDLLCAELEQAMALAGVARVDDLPSLRVV
ncbi:MAG TPA: alpha-hydroxy acid oxidase [candidate division Zixibacteria bacterium]|nr:alpha-hydroxy acid oxidase [candidate division Zixibacteria bacterium]